MLCLQLLAKTAIGGNCDVLQLEDAHITLSINSTIWQWIFRQSVSISWCSMCTVMRSAETAISEIPVIKVALMWNLMTSVSFVVHKTWPYRCQEPWMVIGLLLGSTLTFWRLAHLTAIIHAINWWTRDMSMCFWL